MNQLEQFLQTLWVKGVRLWTQEGKLRYRGPESQLTPELLSQLQQQKAQLIQHLSEATVGPLSYGQNGLWYIQQSAPDNAAYHLSLAFHVYSNLDCNLFQNAAQLLVNRHAALRTTFPVQEGIPVQKVHGYQPVAFQTVDAQGWSEETLLAQLKAEHERPFDLAEGPLFRVTVFVRAAEDFAVLINAHHIVIDGWSTYILLEELLVLYHALQHGIVAQLPLLKQSYTDYVSWQHDLIDRKGDQLWNYWKSQLSGELPVLQLPTDYKRPAVQRYQGKSHPFRLSAELTQSLKRVAQQNGSTLYMLLLSAYQLLLHRYSGQEDLIVGLPMAGRSRPEFVEMVGYFTSPVVVRLDLSNDPAFTQLLQQVRRQVLQALDHQDYPFSLLVKQLNPARDLSRSPIFQADFVLQKPQLAQEMLMASERVTKFGLTLETIPIALFAGQVDVALEMFEMSDGLTGYFKASADLFEEATLARMVDQFQVLLHAIVADPAQSIDRLPLLSAAERQQLLVEWNNTQRTYPQDKCIHHLFEEQVARTPEAVAVVMEEDRETETQGDKKNPFSASCLTYAELNARANQLAHYLQKLGVGPDALVGICVDRSIEMLVGLLGILKAGGAYVPLDPTYPSDRLAFMLQDAAPPVLLTQAHLLTSLPLSSAQVVCLDQDWPQIATQKEIFEASEVQGEHLAYVIYTSGSTGKPKGVQIPHRALTNFLGSMQQQPGISHHDTILAVTTLSFDIAGLELYLPLITGAKVVLVSREVTMDGQRLQAALIRSGATMMQATPATWRLLLAVGWDGKGSNGRQLKLLCGGEALPEALAEGLLARSTELWNLYGPTETTIWSTVQQVRADHPITIGKPIANTQAYILDTKQQLVPVGVAGELYLGGAGVARGYLNRPQLTEEKFIANPFVSAPVNKAVENRLYRTGDMARWLANGTIEYLGRMDHQVKIRGFRIELGEIETLLNQYPLVQQSVVIVREDRPGEKRLVAYLVEKSTGQGTDGTQGDELPNLYSTALRSYLQTKLPDYMVPSVFVLLDALPLTPNGKVDRKALPMPDSFSGEEKESEPPHTLVEAGLIAIWREVLQLPHVGSSDNFFVLGGHSLLATQIVSRIRQTFHVDLPLRTLFQLPTVVQLSREITALQSRQHISARPALVPVARDGQFPPSFAQMRMWFLAQMEGSNRAYHIPLAVEMAGVLDLQALQESWQTLVARHEGLRTQYRLCENALYQEIQPAASLTLPVEIAPERTEAAVASWLTAHNERPFDLSQDLPWRLHLLQLATDRHILLLVLHHIAADGWSLDLLMREWSQLYTAKLQKREADLPPLPIQYADYAVWQRQWLQGVILDQHLNFWREELSGIPSLIELPTDHPRPAVQSYRGGRAPFTLDTDLYLKVQSLCVQQGVTPFMALLTAFQVLLHRYSGQDDIVVGTPIANRTVLETEGVLGMFVNTLALRAQFTSHATFTDLLAQIRTTTQAVYEHQELPFELLVEALQPQRSLSHAPLFQVMFALQNNSQAGLTLPNMTLRFLETPVTTTKFDLTLNLWQNELGISGWWEYSTDLFEAATIERMGEHFKHLLTKLVEDPTQELAKLSLLTDKERHQILVEWNDFATDYPKAKGIHHLFEEQVERTPHAVALLCAEGKERQESYLTYQELNHHANQLAHHLKSLGVGCNVLVGICVDRSVEMIVSILATLKAGGVYVPLDPTYPQARLAFMLGDARAPFVITQDKFLHLLDETEVQTVCIDRDWTLIAQDCAENLDSSVTPDQLAYIIYTSGSTGQPKGVMIEHQALVSHIRSVNKTYQINSQDRVLQFASFSFDAAQEQIFSAFVHGAALILRGNELWTSEEFEQQVRVHQITVANLPPLYFHHLLASWVVKQPDFLKVQLRLLLIGGEKFALETLHLWHQLSAKPQLLNVYGPTEVTVTATSFDLTDYYPAKSFLNMPIGRPFANRKAYILDKYLQPVPVGITGELYIGGASLARGYLYRPELTAEKFLHNPFIGEEEQERLYKTGDLARWLSDGSIEYLGRADHQVKLRGFRIELGEIESVLRQHPAVAETIVVVQEEKSGQQQLVAYVVPSNKLTEPQSTVTISGALPLGNTTTLRSYLQTKLPEYMVPTTFVLLDALPLTPNGKVDRNALPTFNRAMSGQSEGYEPPQNPIEELLAGIWREVLGVEQVGRQENFFDLGGHSLLATQVVSRIRSLFGIEISVRTIFEAATLASLGQAVATMRLNGKPQMTASLQRMERSELLPLSYAQERLWFLGQIEGPSATYNIPLAVKLTGKVDRAALQAALNGVVQRHEVLRTRFPIVDGVVRQVIEPSIVVPLHVVDLQDVANEEQETRLKQLLHKAVHHQFDLEYAPLLQVTLYVLAENDTVLLLNIHHIIADGWSVNILQRELAALYDDFVEQRPASLPLLNYQYADFALWQRQWLQGEIFDQQLAYWQSYLKDVSSLLELPTDYLRPSVQSFRGDTVSFVIEAELSAQLQRLSKEAGASLFMTLFSVFALLLARYSGQDDVVIGTPIANRHHQELETLIGFFVNTLALRVKLNENLTFSELLQQVRQGTLDGYAHQDIGFEQLVGELQIERTLSHSPLFQLMFALNNSQRTAYSSLQTASGVKMTPLNVETGIAKFDLTLSLDEVEDRLLGSFEYNAELFKKSRIERMVWHFQMLLQAIVNDPSQLVHQIPLLTPHEQQQLLVEWNNNPSEYPLDSCVHQLFEQQAERQPEAVAVILDREDKLQPEILSYQELNSRANQLAHYLQSQGVGPETLVGLCMERSIEMMIGLLGILKAGAAYVPLDPTYPKERIAFILQDASVSVLLTQAHLYTSLPNTKAQVVCVDSELPSIVTHSSTNLNLANRPHDLAYLLYTSGSTGLPKGVLIEQAALTNHIHSIIDTYQLASADCVLQFASLMFDVSLEQIFSALCSGASLLLRGNELWSHQEFQSQLTKHRVTVADLPPAYLHTLVESWLNDSPDFLRNQLRLVLVGGEKVRSDTLYLWQQIPNPKPRLLNAYGPSETTITATLFELSDYVPEDLSGNLPIGRPLPNRSVYVLDPHLQLVPIGVTGELFIGGAGLARGYQNRTDLTAQKFIDNRFASGKLYKSGDLVRWTADGNLEFQGRIDHQVKIRGFRIELGEIETLLLQHEDVAEVVVIAREDLPGDKKLVAYWVQRAGGKLHAPDAIDDSYSTSLRNYLQQKLPDYMIPSFFVWMEALPLTPNGKIDRNTLPAPTTIQLVDLETSETTYTSYEATLTAIWQQLLHLPKIGLDDNFFNIGGDSILSIQVVARARQKGLHLTPRQIFQSPTIRQLAAVVLPVNEGVIADQKVVTGTVPLTPIQQWFLEQKWQEPHHYNQAILVNLAPTINSLWLEEALTALLLHHDALRLRFQQVDGEWKQENAGLSERAAFRIVDLAPLPVEERKVQQGIEIEREQISFDLTKGPLLRAALFTYGEDEVAQLLIVIHHLVVDGVSWRILLEDLQTAYEQRSQEEAILLPPKTTSFRDWAHWLAREGVKQVATEQIWWQKVVQQCKGHLPVDLTAASEANTIHSVEDVVCVLPLAETHALLHEAPAAYNTQINDLLLTALVQTICQWNGQSSLMLELEGHGRELLGEEMDEDRTHPIDLSRTVGWFTSLFPVVLQLDQSSPGALIKSIKEQIRRIPQRGIGYGILRYLAQAQDLVPAVPIELSFNYFGQFDAEERSRSTQTSPLFFGLASESLGSMWSPQGQRKHLLDVNATYVQGELRFVWSYSRNFHHRSTIEGLAQHYIDALRLLIDHCCNTGVGGYTPSDFSAPDLDQVELEEILAQLAL